MRVAASATSRVTNWLDKGPAVKILAQKARHCLNLLAVSVGMNVWRICGIMDALNQQLKLYSFRLQSGISILCGI